MSCCAEHQIATTASSYVLGMWSSSPYLTALLFGPILLVLLLVYPALIFLTPKERPLSSSAYMYSTAHDSGKSSHTLPKLVETATNDEEVQLSIVIPAYNERERLPVMMDEAVLHLRKLIDQGHTIQGKSPHKHANGSSDVDQTPSAARNALRSPLRSIEIIIVDDGSKDSTANDVIKYAKANRLDDIVRLVKLGQNYGKGKAVRHGVLHARGALIAFCDADGATRFSDLSNLAKELDRIITASGHGIVCGSRAHLVGTEATVKRSFVRNFLMHSFHLILSLLMRPPNPVAFVQAKLPAFGTSAFKRQQLAVQPPIRDTQCGFKLFTRPSAQAVFPLAHIDRWIFDVELLLLAEIASYTTLRQTAALAPQDQAPKGDPLLRLPLPISEVAVDWREVEGSKIDIVKDSIKMGLDLIVIRLNYAFGRWRTPGPLPDSGNASKATADDCCR